MDATNGRARGAGAVLLLALALPACSSSPVVHTTQLRGGVASPLRGGATYYLPKRVLRLGIWETVDSIVTTIERNEETVVEEPPRVFASILEILTVPDRNYMMRLTTDPSASFHDTVHVAMSPFGLLTEVSTTVTDESPAIVAKLAELATLGAKAPIALSSPRRKAAVGNQRRETRTTLLRTLIVDPTDPASYEPALASHGIVMEATPMLLGTEACCTVEPRPPCDPVCSEPGICYRPVVPYHLRIRPGGMPSRDSAIELEEGFEELLLLPNRSPVVCLPIDRVPFVESSFRATFQDGLLTSVTSDKPSEILGFLEIPIRVAKAIVGIPGELLSFRVTHYDEVRRAASGEAEALKAIQDLAKVQQGDG